MGPFTQTIPFLRQNTTSLLVSERVASLQIRRLLLQYRSSMSDPTATSPGEGAPKNKRATAARELYETEVSYVRSLMILINGFVKPLEASGILSKQDMADLFSNVTVLISFHKDFLKQLKERIDTWNDESIIGMTRPFKIRVI